MGSGGLRSGGRAFSLNTEGPSSPRQKRWDEKTQGDVLSLRRFKREKEQTGGVNAIKLLIREGDEDKSWKLGAEPD